MYLLWYIVYCFALSFMMAAIFEKKFESSIITGQLGSIVMLYIFYLANLLHIGVYVIYLAILLGTLFVLYTVRQNTVNLVDELHLWGALPKILATQHGTLRLKESMLLGYEDYVLGMPLYLSFLMRVKRLISEPLQYQHCVRRWVSI